jgi:hypothetical protein
MIVDHSEMDQTEQLAARIQRTIPKVPKGSLRFWGEWFGRPYDNWHTLVSCRAEQNILRLSFDQDETLSVWSPTGLTLDQSTFRIFDADRVRWEWFYYGRAKTPENLYFEEFTKSGEGISSSTNIDWYTPAFQPRKTEAAVEILSLMR